MNARFVLSMLIAFACASASLTGCSSNSSPSMCHAAKQPLGDGSLRHFTPPDPTKLTTGQLLLTASGEALAQQGYMFPDIPANGVFADGWEVHFQHFIAIFDKVKISNNPNKVKSDQSQTDNDVAEADGPWIIDLAKATPNDVAGKEQGEMATPFAVITSQNLCGNQPFATDGTAYAVGFSAVAASSTISPINVNLDAEGQQIYAEMLAGGCAVVYDGTATFKVTDPTTCTTQDPEFARFPAVVHFHLCFKSPTTYTNCDNADVKGPSAKADEPHPRGIQFPPNGPIKGEITFHTDHPFWESVVHDTPAHFDQFASRIALPDGGAPGAGDGAAPTVTMDNLVGANYLAYTDEFGNPVPWRSCVKDSTGNQYGQSTRRMRFDPQGVPQAAPGPNPTTAGLRDYYDYSTYNQSTQGHWNGVDGLCFVTRNYPSPL
jgi:hypothetical protein